MDSEVKIVTTVSIPPLGWIASVGAIFLFPLLISF
jgi:hypothetical protein